MDTKQISLLVIRTVAAAGLTLAILLALHPTAITSPSALGRIVTVALTGVAGATILSVALLALGHRWHAATPAKG